jgi:hypothetical protein
MERARLRVRAPALVSRSVQTDPFGQIMTIAHPPRATRAWSVRHRPHVGAGNASPVLPAPGRLQAAS